MAEFPILNKEKNLSDFRDYVNKMNVNKELNISNLQRTISKFCKTQKLGNSFYIRLKQSKYGLTCQVVHFEDKTYINVTPNFNIGNTIPTFEIYFQSHKDFLQRLFNHNLLKY